MMLRRVLFGAWLAAMLLAAPVQGKFGIRKTHATFLLRHPPAFYVPTRDVDLDITSLDPRGGRMVVPQLRQILGEALLHEDFRVSPSARTRVRLALTEAAAFVEEHAWRESVNVRVGERTEKDEKGKEGKVQDCKVEAAEVVYLVSAGGLFVDLTATDEKAETVLFNQRIQKQYWAESPLRGPERCDGQRYGLRQGQLQDPVSILARLSELVAADAVPLLAGFDEPREVLLAVDDELKAGNVFAQAGEWQQALDAWKNASVRADDRETEAARQYNLGVGSEALAASAIRSEDFRLARVQLDKAAEFYNRALGLDPEEKYFREPFGRLRESREILQKFEANQFSK